MKSWPPSGHALCSFLSVLSKHLARGCLLKTRSLNPPQGIGVLCTSPPGGLASPYRPRASTVQLLPRRSLYPTPRPASQMHVVNWPGPLDEPRTSLNAYSMGSGNVLLDLSVSLPYQRIPPTKPFVGLPLPSQESAPRHPDRRSGHPSCQES